MSRIDVTVIEQPGALGKRKALALCAFFKQYYADHKEEVDAYVEKLREQQNEKGAVSCPAGNMSADSSSCSLA